MKQEIRKRVATNKQTVLKEVGSHPKPEHPVKMTKDIRSGYGKDQATDRLSSSLEGRPSNKPAKMTRNKRSSKNY